MVIWLVRQATVRQAPASEGVPRGPFRETRELAGWPLTGEVIVDRARLRYKSGGPLALADVSLRIQPGERVGICGRTGHHPAPRCGHPAARRSGSRCHCIDSGLAKIRKVCDANRGQPPCFCGGPYTHVCLVVRQIPCAWVSEQGASRLLVSVNWRFSAHSATRPNLGKFAVKGRPLLVRQMGAGVSRGGPEHLQVPARAACWGPCCA